jgi:hypothetical protein
MVAFLCVTASVAVLAGLISLVAGAMPPRAWLRNAPRAAV